MDDFGSVPGLARTFSAHSQLLNDIAQRVLQRSQSLAPSAHVRSAISVEQVGDSSSGAVSVVLKADRRIAPDARAYEYGSGEKARRSEVSPHQLGSKQKILIEAKNGLFLSFKVKTEKGMEWIHPTSALHPGVDAANNGEGYLRKAVKDTNAANRKEASSGAANAVRLELRARFGKIGER